MPGGNGLTPLPKRKHGVCPPSVGVFSGLLVALCCLEVWGSGPQGDHGGSGSSSGASCGPCPLNCSCALAGPQQAAACVVNCSSLGLDRAPAAADLPLATSVLDLSKNHISSLDTSLLDRLIGLRELYLQGNRIKVLPRGVFCCGPLSVINVSNNLISTIEERICENLCNLTEIDLSNNPFECNCKLSRLISWLRDRGVQVRRPEAMLCDQPTELRHQPLLNVSLLTCGLNYAACLEDSGGGVGGGRSELVIFTSSTPGNFTREQCNSVCFAASHRYGGLGASQECLCSTNSEPNFISESQCSAACTNRQVMEECGWTLAQDVFAVDFFVKLNPLPLQSVHSSVAFSAVSSVTPLTLSWDFGDLSARVNTTGSDVRHTASHKYGLPGRYVVGLMAWAGNSKFPARSEVTVTLPPKLELHCPPLAVANSSLDITLASWGSAGLDVDWKITKDGLQVAKASPNCPEDGVHHTESSRCFQIVPAEMSWLDARKQCSERGGDLAVVRSDTLRNLLAHKVIQERGAWLGLSDVKSAGRLRWVNGSDAGEGEEGLPPRTHIARGNVCVSLDQRGQTSLHPCTAKRAFICQYGAQVHVSDTGVFLLGPTVFPTCSYLHHATSAPVSPPHTTSTILELLLFPALSFIQSGRLSSLEFLTQELTAQTNIRFQTYRPHCHYPFHHLLLPGCGGLACASVAMCVSQNVSRVDPPPCPQQEQWCPFQLKCLPLATPCHPSSCPNCTDAHHLPQGALEPCYALQDEVIFTLPPGPAAHVVLQDQLENLLVSHGDVIALQHDAGPASLLRCHSSSVSSSSSSSFQLQWRQPVLALNQSEWFGISHTKQGADLLPDPELDVKMMVDNGDGRWLQDAECPVRVLYVGYSETRLQGPLLTAGLAQPGLYSLMVTSVEPSYPTSASCPLWVVPPLCLTILHPSPVNGTVYLQPNDTRLLLRVQSRYDTVVSCHSGTGGNSSNCSAMFQSGCPREFASWPALCQPGPSSGLGAEVTEPSLYTVVDVGALMRDLGGGRDSPVQVYLEARNNVTEASKMVAVQLEEPLAVLVVQPHPARRVLMESVVSYTASVLKGSNPTYKWTVDDKPFFTYYNTVLNVIYQHAAVYKLTVTATNHISSLTEDFNVTVDRLQPMANLSVRGIPDVVPQGSTQTLTTSVLLDMSVAATVRWFFGDGGYEEFEYKPPYDLSLLSLESPNQILLSNNVTYVYSQPGIYPAVVSVSNRYENLSRSIQMSVYSILTRVDIQTEPQLLLAGKKANFEAHPLPSPYGIHYEWHFEDGSVLLPTLQGRRVAHTFSCSGLARVCVIVNNTISQADACADLFVYEEIEQLVTESSAPTELHTATVVSAEVGVGNNVTWTFAMGDGTVYTGAGPNVSHMYTREGNYTVNVSASNAVSSGWHVFPVEVFVFRVVSVEPTGCFQVGVPVGFHAWATGDISTYVYEWDFGEGSQTEVRHGSPMLVHTYWSSGSYNLSLSLTSGASRVAFHSVACVQPLLANVSLAADKTHYMVGEEVRLWARAEPNFNYTYRWDFGWGVEEQEREEEWPPVVVMAGRGDITTAYRHPGSYQVSVGISNNISACNASIFLQVLTPVGPLLLRHNGTKFNNLTLGAPFLFSVSSRASDATYLWDFGDGTQTTTTTVGGNQNVIHAYRAAGRYNVTLTASNHVSSGSSFLAVAVVVPLAGLSVNASLVNVPLNASVHFEARLDEGEAMRFSWILCDRCTPIVGTSTMFYTFRSVGAFNITVTAENEVGVAQASIFLFVQRELESLQILWGEGPEGERGGALQGCCFATNSILHLQADLKEGTNMTFTWNLRRDQDPASSVLNVSGKALEVNFSTPGQCDIQLQAANLLGQLSVNHTVHFLDPVADPHLHVAAAGPVALGAAINLTATAGGGSELQYHWWVNGKDLLWDAPWKSHSFDSAGHQQVTVEIYNRVSVRTASAVVSVQEPISGLRFKAKDMIEQNYVATGITVWLQGDVDTGTNVTWTWLLEGRTEAGKKTSLIFLEPKTAYVALNATNDVSSQAVHKEFFVQERIQGLELRANNSIVAVGDWVEFNLSLSAGSDVQLILSISGDATVIKQPNQTYVHHFSRVDTYMVNLTAHNQVSSKRRQLQVEVMELVRGLSIVGSSVAIAVGEKRRFVANITTGKPISFLWTFDLQHHHHLKTTIMGKEVFYVPKEPGLLTVYLKAFNSLHNQNVTQHIVVQQQLRVAILDALPQDTLVNKLVILKALVSPRGSPLDCLWDFGDGSSQARSPNTPVGHKYRHPGHYQLQVNCSNMVSWVVAHAEVNISMLECEEPEVQIQAPRLVIWHSQSTQVEASVNLKGCVRYGAQYLWQILAAPSCGDDEDKDSGAGGLTQTAQSIPVVPLPPEVDVQRLQLSLPKMVLPAGKYTLVFSLSYENVPLRKAACLQLTVMTARLMPIIEGGTYREWPSTQDLQLSAEQSYDPNMDPENQSLLHYNWVCESPSKGPDHCNTLNSGLGSSDPVLGISRKELEPGVKYTFRLTISKEGMAPESTTQTVLVRSAHIPMVSLECVSCKAQSLYEVSHNSYVYLRGSCSNCVGIPRWRWSAMTLQNDTLVLDLSSTTTGSNCKNLVLRQGVLHHHDSYVFTLHVNDDSLDGEGAASITLEHNTAPSGGQCYLSCGGEAGLDFVEQDAEVWRIKTLVDRVQFNCSGYRDVGVSETPLLYSLLVTRCREDYCEEFCVYKGSSPEHSAFLPPGFSSSRHRVSVSVTVEDHQGAVAPALNKTIEVLLPDPPAEYSSLPHWLCELTDSKLKKLLEQGDSQRVRELSLALITVLNEYEQTRESVLVSRRERAFRVGVRTNITKALTALDLSTVNDIQQTSAALAQCTAVSREFICEECQNSTLNKLESMLEILQTDTKQGIVTPTEIGDNILNIMGDLIHQVSQSASQLPYVDAPSPSSAPWKDLGTGLTLDPSSPSAEHHPLRVAAKAYSLSSVLMLILMHARVLNEEPLVLRGAEIAATGKLADPQSLLCYDGNDSPECQLFSIPRAFNNSLGRAAAGNSIMQLLFQVESNPFPFNYVANYTVSTEVVSMEFRTENGTHIPISGLNDSLAITVAVSNFTGGSGGAGSEAGPKGSSEVGGVPVGGAVNISQCGSVIVRVSAGNSNRQAGLSVQLNFTVQEDMGHKEEEQVEEPYITAYLHSHPKPNEFNCTEQKRIVHSATRGPDRDHRKYTFFLSPESYDTTLDYFINVSASCGRHSRRAAVVRLEVGVFASLCQYFSDSEQQWRTDGMVPLAETNASRAVCRTRHLTAFGAGMIVPPGAVSFVTPERSGVRSLVVLLVVLLGLLSYIVAAVVLHKLDQLELRRAAVVPLCGPDGLFKYEVQLKTGWSHGAGTTAHVGISLYGRESRSGHRHLDSRGAFARNSLDIFHVATDTNLGNIWKVRIWHDNKGLSPAWLLQYVLVKDLQTGSSYYFLVEEWLSVDNDRTEGQVEVKVEASEEAALLQLPRLLRCELQRALCESHLWLSLFERPTRSPFTRLQRATCCALLLQLVMVANALWYSIVADKRHGPQAVSKVASLSGETVAAGVVTCLVVYPLYLLAFTLFRMSRSKCVSVEQVPPQVDQESVEIDDFLDNSMAGSSFLFFNGETNSEETNVDLPTPSTKSMESWVSAEDDMEDQDWPELPSDTSVVGGAGHGMGLPRLKRGQGSRHLGVDMTFNPDSEEGAEHSKCFTSSDEDLIKHILTDGQNFFPQADDSEMVDLSSILDDKTEVILLQKLNEPLPLESLRRDPPKTAFTSNTVVTDVCRPRRFPPLCGSAALWGSWTLIGVGGAVSVWAGLGFSQNVSMMWLISCFASFLCSCLLLEPLKVACEAAYYAVCVRRLRQEDQDVLVEFPRVERVVQRVHRVRPPHGFALAQDRQQARKVHLLHTMLKNFLVYMLFLLVVLLLNYSDSGKDTHALRLRTQLQRALHTPEYHNIKSRDDVLTWLNKSLLPRLLDNDALLRDTGSVLLGSLRLRQVRDAHGGFRSEGQIGSKAWITSWSRAAGNLSAPTGGPDLNRLLVTHRQLNRSLEEASSSLQRLEQQHWLDFRTRATSLDFSLYNVNTDLLAVFSFLFEFPVSERAQSSLDLCVVTLWPITGLDLQLLLVLLLMALVLYFLVRGIMGLHREGFAYLLSVWRLLGVCKLALAASVCGLHLSRCTAASLRWAELLKNPRDAFTDFQPLARQNHLYIVTSALLLFVLVLKASHQLRLLREWAVFGRALRRSVRELLAVSLALLLLLLAYSHAGHLLFHSVADGYDSISATCLSLLAAGRRALLSWRGISHGAGSGTGAGPPDTLASLAFHSSFAVLRLAFLWLLTSVLLRNYRRARAELYRPAVDLQDYEMVELFLRRLKMWMGLSRTKEFRHKVRFEGLELPPSRSSSTSDCRSLCLPPLDGPDAPPTPDSVDGGSEASWRPASSSPCSLTEAPGVGLGLGPGPGLGVGLGPGPSLSPSVMVGSGSWREQAETEASLKRLLPTLDALLQQLDRVTAAAEDLYHAESRLEQERQARRQREDQGQGQGGGQREGWGERSKRRSGKEPKQKGSRKAKRKEPAKDCGNATATSTAAAAHLRKTPAAAPTKSRQVPLGLGLSGQSAAGVHPPAPQDLEDPASNSSPVLNAAPPHRTPVPGPSHSSTPAPPPVTCNWDPPPPPSSSLFNHPAHTTTIPTRKRKRKPPPLKNKVHPNLDHHSKS